VARQDTTSIRTVLGANFGAAMPLSNARKLDVTIRLGWAHEHADTTRPMTASFAGAPAIPFTVYGAEPLRDGVVMGFGLDTKVADTISLYARYDGEISGRDDAHTVSAGLRMTW
jgi:outer membrane autotransporter protein